MASATFPQMIHSRGWYLLLLDQPWMIHSGVSLPGCSLFLGVFMLRSPLVVRSLS